MRSTTRNLLAATGSGALVAMSAVAAVANDEVERPATFTSAFTVMATPDAVVDSDGESAPGEPGASGTFDYMINSEEEIICYDLVLEGVTPPYESPALTATHIHEADAGEAGPPRVVFPDPTGEGDRLTSSGCMQGPFTTGLTDDDDNDHGEGFSLAQIEADPAAFFGDTHTADHPSGAVRGQLQQVPVGGVDTGLGGAADQGGLPTGLLIVGGAVAAGAVTAFAVRGAATRRTDVQ